MWPWIRSQFWNPVGPRPEHSESLRHFAWWFQIRKHHTKCPSFQMMHHSGYHQMWQLSSNLMITSKIDDCTLLQIPNILRGREVFPWGGNSVIFSVCASISRTGVQLHEINIWLDPRSLNKSYGALMFPKVNIIVIFVATPTSKMVKTTSPVDRVRVWARVSV